MVVLSSQSDENEKKLPAVVIGAVKSVGGEGAAISTYDVVPGCTYELGIKYPTPGFFTAVINIFLPRK